MTTFVRLTYQQLEDAMAVTVPEGESGNVAIRRFTVSEQDARFFNLRQAFSYGGRGRSIKAGTYTKLVRNRTLWMSDTPAERHDHVSFVKDVADDATVQSVLVTGLGIGMVAQALTMILHVQRVTVVELDSDVIALVGTHLRRVYEAAGKELYIIQGDAKDVDTLFPKPITVRWNAAWHDIWPDISGDNWEDIKLMRRKYRSRVTGFQGFWAEDLVRDAARRDRQDRRW